MVCGALVLQLVVNRRVMMRTGAAEKAVPLQNGFVTRTHLGGTAYVRQCKDVASWPHPFVSRLPPRISHTGSLEASPSRPQGVSALASLGDPTADPRFALHDLVLWRFASRTLRDRQGL